MPKIKIATVFNIELEFVTSDLPRRVVAYLVDLTILSLYFLTVKSLLYGPTTDLDDIRRKMGLDILVISLPMLLYSLICEVMMHVGMYGGWPCIAHATEQYLEVLKERGDPMADAKPKRDPIEE